MKKFLVATVLLGMLSFSAAAQQDMQFRAAGLTPGATNQSVGGTFGVTGATTLSSTLGVTGATTLGDTCEITGATTVASLVCTAAGTFGGGYGSTGATVSTAGVGQFNGALTTDGALTADNLVCTNAATFGGGYGSSGATISTAGVGQFNGALTVDGASTLTGVVTATAGVKTALDVGAAAGTCTAVEWGDGAIHKTVVTLNAVGVTLADGAHGSGELIYTFPQGVVKILGVTLDGTVTNTALFNASTADTYSFALGQVVAADDDDLTSTEATVFAKVTEDTVDGSVLSFASDGYFATDLAIDGHTTPATIYANWAIAAANNSDANDFTLTGTVTITWVNLGDY